MEVSYACNGGSQQSRAPRPWLPVSSDNIRSRFEKLKTRNEFMIRCTKSWGYRELSRTNQMGRRKINMTPHAAATTEVTIGIPSRQRRLRLRGLLVVGL